MSEQDRINKLMQEGQLETADDRALRLNNSLSLGMQKQPKAAGEAMQLATENGVSTGAVEQNIDQARIEQRIKKLDLQGMLQHSPTTSDYLQDPEKAAVAHDDIDNLTGIERVFRAAYEGAVSGAAKQRKAELRWRSVFGKGLNQAEQSEFDRLSERMGRTQGEFGQKEDFASWIYQGADMAGMMAAMGWDALENEGVAGLVTGSAIGGSYGAAGGTFAVPGLGTVVGGAGGAAGGGVLGLSTGTTAGVVSNTVELTFDEAYSDLVDEYGLDPELAKVGASAYAALATGLELGGMKRAIAVLPGGKDLLANLTLKQMAEVLKRKGIKDVVTGKAKDVAASVAYNSVEEGAQKAMVIAIREGLESYAGENEDYDMEQLEQDLADIGTEAWMAFKGAAVTGGLGGSMSIANEIRTLEATQSDQARKAEFRQQVMNSKLRENNPAEFRALMKRLGEETGTDKVYLEAEGAALLMQSDEVDEAFLETPLGKQLAEQLPLAMESGDYIEIPIEMFAGDMIGESMDAQLDPYIKIDVDSMTQNEEAQQGLQEQIDLITEMDAEQRVAEAEVYESVYGQLIEAKVDPAEAERGAIYYEAAFRTLAKKVNAGGKRRSVTAKTLFDEQFGGVRAEPTLEAQQQAAATVQFDNLVDRIRTGDLVNPVGAELTPEEQTAKEQLDMVESLLNDAGLDPEAMSNEEIREALSAASPEAFAQALYHGTPHKVDRFSMDKIGTGEGAQAYGWGLYFAEQIGVAGRYRAGGPMNLNSHDPQFGFSWADSYTPSPRISGIIEGAEKPHVALHQAMMEALGKKDQSLIDEITEAQRNSVVSDPGNLYEVEVPDEAIDKMLDWDKPLSEQPESVKEAIRANPAVSRKIAEWQQSFGVERVRGEEIYSAFSQFQSGFETTNQRAGSEELQTLGVPGIKYLDGGSRSAGEGSRNIVVFDESLITITAENGKPVSFDEAMEAQAEEVARYEQVAQEPFTVVGKDASVEIDGKTYKPQRVDRGDSLVLIDREALESLLTKTQMVGPAPDYNNQIKDRIERFKKFWSENDEINVGNLFVGDGENYASFGDGRHRARVMLDSGMQQIPVSMSEDSIRNLNRAIKQAEEVSRYEQTTQRKAKVSEQGFYSAVEQAVLDMNLPGWKNDGAATGQEIYQKVVKMQGVKKEELEWLGLADYLKSGDVFTREEVAEFIRENGVQVEVIESEAAASEELTLTPQPPPPEALVDKLFVGPEAQQSVNDLLANLPSTKFLNTNAFLTNMFSQNANNPEFLSYLQSELELSDEALEKIKTAPPEDYDTHGHFWRDTIPRNRTHRDYPFWPFIKRHRSVIRKFFDDDAEALIWERAKQLYTDNPVELYKAEHPNGLDEDLFILGNEQFGYDLYEGNIESHSDRIRLGISSLNEARVQIADRLRDPDYEDPNEARWGQYVMEGDHDNYREVKLTLPGNPGETFSNPQHFDNDNIVAFLRVTDRALQLNKKDRNTSNTYFIDELQSDWHQQGRQEGYSTGLDAGVLEEEYFSLRSSFEDAINALPPETMAELESIWLDHPNGETMTDRATGKVSLLTDVAKETARRLLHYQPLKADTRLIEVLKNTEAWPAFEQADAMRDKVQAERYGVPDAPFKGDAWLTLAMRRAVIEAVENGYEAIAFPNASVLMDRWSDSFEQMYTTQYDRKMPSIMKKIAGSKPEIVFDVNGTGHGYYIVPVTEELKAKIMDDGGLPLFQQDAGPQEAEQAYVPSAEEKKLANWNPPKDSKGKYKGVPPGAETAGGLRKLRNHIAKLVKEGETGRYWYEESAAKVMEVVQGDLVEAEKLTQLIAIYSPQAKVQVNTVFAIRAWNQWKTGVSREDFKVKTGDQDDKAIDVLYDNKPFKGRKTSSFYLNLMHDIVTKNPGALEQLQLGDDLVKELSKPVTIDLWMLRAYGYTSDAASDDVAGTGRYSTAEKDIQRLAARMNQSLQPGEEPYSPHQLQAMIWSAMKARYEMPDVKAATWAESLKKGYATLNEKGQKVLPATAEGKRKHGAIWRKHAMKVDSALVPPMVEQTRASYSTYLDQMTEVVTWEAQPSEALGLDIFNASPAVKRAFTDEARELVVVDGVDELAVQLGVPLAYVINGNGGYGANVNPNLLSHLIPDKPAGPDFSVDQVRAYARSIQYIFKQDAVPWLRADPLPLTSQDARAAQKFRVINTETGRMVSSSSRDLLAEANEVAEAKNAALLEAWEKRRKAAEKKGKEFNEDKPAPKFEVRGGKYARGVNFTLSEPASQNVLEEMLQSLSELLGPDVGLTQVSPTEFIVVNFRDDDTGVPSMKKNGQVIDDEAFFDIATEFADANEAIITTEAIWTEGEYGYRHDWEGDPQGQALIADRSLAEQPDLQAWVRDRRAAFEQLLEAYSGEQLEQREQEQQLLEQADSVAALNQQDGDRSLEGTTAGVAPNAAEPAPTQPRGYFDPNTRQITLTPRANASTFLHESGHLFLEIYRDLAPYSDEIQADLDVVYKWAGATKDWGKMSQAERRRVHEKFASGFEAYLREGKAPIPELQGVFSQFRAWLRAIYDSGKSVFTRNNLAGVELSDEVRKMMDRIVAMDDEIENAEQQQRYTVLPIEQMGQTPEQVEAYLKAVEKAKLEAEQQLTERVMGEMRRERAPWWKKEMSELVETISAQLDNRKEQAIRDFLSGRRPLEGMEAFKLDVDAVERLYGAEAADELRSMRVAKKGGIHPDQAARALGFDTGEELTINLQRSMSPKERKAFAAEQAQKEMVKRHGDILNDGRLADEAQEAIHNNEQGKLHLLELRILNEMLGNKAATRSVPKQTLSIYREAAKRMIAGMSWKQVQPHHHLSKERKYGSQFAKLAAQGKYQEAREAKHKQLRQFYLYQEAVRAKKAGEKHHRRLQQMKKTKYDAKKVHPDYIQNLKVLLSLYDLRKRPTAKDVAQRLSQVQKFLSAQEDANPGLIANVYIQSITDWRDLSVQDLESLRNAAENMLKIGRALSDEAYLELSEQAAEAKQALEDSTDKRAGPSEVDDPTKLEKLKTMSARFKEDQIMLYTDIRAFDGYETNGVWYRNVLDPISAASDVRAKMNMSASEQLHEMLKPFRGKLNRSTRKQIKAARSEVESLDEGLIKRRLQSGAAWTLSAGQRVMLAVYWGSPESRQAILDSGYQGAAVTAQDVQVMLDLLTDEQVQLVRNIWTFNEQYWSELARIQKELTGIAPVKVDHAPFRAGKHTLPGGYQRIYYHWSEKDGQKLDMHEQAGNAMNVKSGVTQSKTGASIERKGSGGRQLRLEVGNVARAADEMINFIAYAETSRQVGQFLNHPDVKNTIIEVHGKEKYQSFIDSVDGIFAGNAEGGGATINAAMRKVRTNLSVGYLTLSLRNFVQQPFAITNSFARNGEWRTMKAMTRMIWEPVKTYNWIKSKSVFMQERNKIVNREVAEQNAVLENSSEQGWLAQRQFFMQVLGDMLATYPTWLASYYRGLEEAFKPGMSREQLETAAARFADLETEAMIGSGRKQGMSPMFQGSGNVARTVGVEASKQLTFMGTFFGVTYNLYADAWSRYRNGKITFGGFVREMLWYMVVPGILTKMVVDHLPDEDDDEGWAQWMAEATLEFGLSASMFWRNFASVYRGFEPNIPAYSFFSGMGRLGREGVELFDEDDEFTKADIASMLRGLQPVAPIMGSGQAARTLEQLDAVEQGDEDPNVYNALVKGKER